MSGKVMGKRAAKGVSRQKHASRVGQAVKLHDKAHKRTEAPTAVDEYEIQRQLNQSQPEDNEAMNGRFKFPVSALHIGHHLQGHPADTKLQALEDYVKISGAADAGRGGAGPHGLIMAPTDQIIDRAMWSKEQELYLGQLALAEKLIDAKNPETQEKAYALFPQLQSVPDEYYQEQMALQEALRTLLRDGQIRGQEDNALIARICADDFVLPMLPAWDPSGIIVGQIDAFRELMRRGYQRGLFSPRQWGSDLTQSDEMKEQRKVKTLILRRLYPGLRDAPKQTLDQIIDKMSMIYPGSSVSEGVFNITRSNVETYRRRQNGSVVGPPGTGLPAWDASQTVSQKGGRIF
jgi:hypothetical protein